METTITLDKNAVVVRLLVLPTELATAEAKLLAAQSELLQHKNVLDENEATLTLRGLEGKNEGERKASLYVQTLGDRDRVQRAQEQVQTAALNVRMLQTELSSLRAISRLCGAE